MNDYSRDNKKWGVNELLALEREYELLEMSIIDISTKHKRKPQSILFCLKRENIIDNETRDGWKYNSGKWIQNKIRDSVNNDSDLTFVSLTNYDSNDNLSSISIINEAEITENKFIELFEPLQNKILDLSTRLEHIETKILDFFLDKNISIGKKIFK